MDAQGRRSWLLVAGVLSCLLAAQCSDRGPVEPAVESDPSEGRVASVASDPVPEHADARAQPSAAPPPPGGIRLTAGSFTTRNLGQVREGEGIETAFELVSDGEGPLVIESAKPSCGCTVPGIFLHDRRGALTPYELGTPIPVGTRFRLLAKVHTQGQSGSFGTNIALSTNDPVGVFSVRIEAEVEPMLDISPGTRIDIEHLGEHEREVRVVRVETRRGEPFALTETFLPDGIQLEPTPLVADAQGRSSAWDVELTVGPGLPPGDVRHTLRLSTDLEIQDPRDSSGDGSPQFHTVVLEVQKLGLVHAQPAFLNFGSVEPGTTVERTTRIASRDGFPFHSAADLPIEVVGTDGSRFEFADRVRTTLVPSQDAQSVELRIAIDCPVLERERAFVGALNVRVAHPWQELLIVRFTVHFRASPAPAAADGD